ncbi:sensor histidine kinase [Leifsonia sp. A12D58]|uniref:sensor histidine kinase n=1 Tax=Leifsonia sp. A12D58 TaxID=3397674 RepID=UPI0039E0F437
MTRSDPRAPVRSVHTTWAYTLSSIVFFFVVLDIWPIIVAVQEFVLTRSALDALLMVLVLITAGIHVRYCWFLRVGRGGGLPHIAWTVALVTPAASIWILGLFRPSSAMLLGIPLWLSLCLIACLIPRPRRRVLLSIGFVLLLGHPAMSYVISGTTTTVFSDRGSWMLAFYGLVLPAMLLSSLWWWEIVVKLDRHRSTAAELAVTQERLRFAADLHDIQGHHLQVIALKSELAERMLTIDVEAARVHIHETRLIAKEALEETRLLVAGYRDVALDDELENAREVLTAAGTHCELTVDPLPTDVDLRRALGMTVREATTNILRHSDATHATIEFRSTADRHTLEISNDGVVHAPSTGDDFARDGSPRDGSRVAGSGLVGLRDRVTAVGGTLTTAAAGGRFTLVGQVPASVVSASASASASVQVQVGTDA